MRKIVKTKWGVEVIFAQEDWFTGSILEIGFNRGTDYKKAPMNIIYHVLQGSVQIMLNGALYEFGEGKTILVRKGTKYQIIGTKSVPRVIKIAQYKLEDKDLSSVTKGHI